MAEEGQMNFKMLALIIVLVIIITGVASFTFFTYFSVSSDEDNKDEIQSVEDIRPTYNAGSYTVNISNNNQINFVRATLVFELENAELKKELEKRKPQIRDRVISTLRAQNKEILEEPGSDTIKGIIKEKINGLLISGKITNVWFTELVVQ
ncbi:MULTISPECIES: flagellar basal body-associated protein FliL [Halanaerobium]|jgi:flagellar FliL protein|uniref:Flagellar protein FliL n=1 Tax=Halanaerobium saccharolyticum TaxID=43595 RepID=A0A4R6RTB6_9FIRM|nr:MULTISPECIES: flagellar basal body-associated FliL family protein [Halanaerobium]PUU94681.1 MAG: flagellar FliL protein [Halanaerobium sp.]PUU95359.1 MAG: flagellar FliL protein [Halanaerobium sp.]TDP89246.1 flagellar FliL protein [Halanaerobium saccharolyticum]